MPSLAVVPKVFHALHPGRAPTLQRARIATPSTVTGMGTLLELELGALDDPDRVTLWRFSAPLPRLGFEHVSPSAARGARISRLWIVGGAFYVDARGRFHGGGTRTAMRIRGARGAPAREVARYARTHGGRAPTERVTAPLHLSTAIPVGWLRAVSYHTDKRERADRDPADYRHAFEGEARPLLCVTGDGRGFVVLSDKDLGPVRYGDHLARRFGRYTVTPHGVEDLA